MSEQYDTDCIISDITTQNKCNILLYGLNNNFTYVKYIKQFIKNRNLLFNVLYTGFHFFYHTFYSNIENRQNIKIIGDNYFISAHFNSIKEEILNSEFINMKQFQQHIIKGNKFM